MEFDIRIFVASLLIFLTIIYFTRGCESFQNEGFNNHPIKWHKTSAAKRNLVFEKILLNLDLPKKSKILDIGGNNWKKFAIDKGFFYTPIDLESAQKTGEGGYNADKKGLLYDGRNLSFGSNEFDLVIVNFVLHHASHNTLFLLKQIKNISKKYVIISEDLSELDYESSWHERNFKHQPGGVFRSDEEWRELFRLYGFEVIRQDVYNYATDKVPGRLYRTAYLLNAE